ncbi:MAG: hypothetical protein BWY98_01087 [Tenericutes bacterium ADurb.BinA155]|jgi:hypothetical protein|nr:MAG: hypothetical protein BWY98_01087 [Tenericutes bacterium ADurb.BinA155]
MKAAKISIFALAGAIFVTAVTLFFVYTIHGPMQIGEGGEALGWVLAGLMACMMLIFIIRTIFRSPKTKPATKAKLLPVYQVMNQLHMPIGTVAVACLYLHFAMVFDINDPSKLHLITGYVMAGLLASIVALGFIGFFDKKPSRKVLVICHQIAVVAILAMFIVHLLVK